jgi:Transposase IS116/IS110/IS902 family
MGDNCEDARSRNGVERCCVLPQGRVFRRPRLVGLRQLVQKHFPDGIPAQASLLGHLSAGVAFIEHFPANHRPLSNVVIHGKPRQSRIENAASRRDRSPNPRLSFYIAPCLLPKGDQGWCPKRGSPALSLYPRQFTTGGKPKLLGISKRGNSYLRKLLIHGARAALPYVAERDVPLGRWAKSLLSRAHPNVVVVAFANKLARIAWAVLRRGEPFAAKGLPVAA